MTATLTAGTLSFQTSLPKSPRARAALRRTVYAPIDEHRTSASNGDVAAAWLAAGLIGVILLGALPL